MGATAAGLAGYETYKWLKGKQKFDVGTQKDRGVNEDGLAIDRMVDVMEQDKTPKSRARRGIYDQELNERMARLRARGVEFDPVIEPLLSELREMEDSYDREPPDD
jgi:hypothetical protein